MRIQWSSGAALEMISQLERAKQGLEICRQRANSVRNAMDDANPDGENKVLRKAREKFEAQAESLRSFSEELENFISAVQKADRLFTDADAECVRLADGTGQTPVWTENRRNVSSRYINWEAPVYAAMPGMRMNVAPVPEWLDNIVKEDNILYFE